jgi:hypothetical protein
MTQTSKHSNSNGRSSPRRAAEAGTKVTCRRGTSGPESNLALQVLDVSQGGVRLVTRERLEEGEAVVVSLLPPGCTREYHLPGQVAWCLDMADGSHVVGVRFERRLSDAEVLYLARHPGA